MKDVALTVDPKIKPELTHKDGVRVSKKSKVAVLIQNEVGSYKYVPEELANDLVKEHKAVIMKPTDPDYLKAVRLAIGVVEGFAAGECIQFGGKAMRPEEIGKLDTKRIIADAEALVKDLTDEDGIVKVKELPESLESFSAKQRQRMKK
jgi:hypothetical protein